MDQLKLTDTKTESFRSEAKDLTDTKTESFRPAGVGDACKRCNCKKFQCTRITCDCFGAGVCCSEPCSCVDCLNKASGSAVVYNRVPVVLDLKNMDDLDGSEIKFLKPHAAAEVAQKDPDVPKELTNTMTESFSMSIPLAPIATEVEKKDPDVNDKDLADTKTESLGMSIPLAPVAVKDNPDVPVEPKAAAEVEKKDPDVNDKSAVPKDLTDTKTESFRPAGEDVACKCKTSSCSWVNCRCFDAAVCCSELCSCVEVNCKNKASDSPVYCYNRVRAAYDLKNTNDLYASTGGGTPIEVTYKDGLVNISLDDPDVDVMGECEPFPWELKAEVETKDPDVNDKSAVLKDLMDTKTESFSMSIPLAPIATEVEKKDQDVNDKSAVPKDLTDTKTESFRPAGEGDASKRCNCKKFQCTRITCDCFGAGVCCSEPCSCVNCLNKASGSTVVYNRVPVVLDLKNMDDLDGSEIMFLNPHAAAEVAKKDPDVPKELTNTKTESFSMSIPLASIATEVEKKDPDVNDKDLTGTKTESLGMSVPDVPEPKAAAEEAKE